MRRCRGQRSCTTTLAAFGADPGALGRAAALAWLRAARSQGRLVAPRVLVVGFAVAGGLAGPPPAARVPAFVEEVGGRPRAGACALGAPGRERVGLRFLRPRPLRRRHPRGQGRVDVGGGRSVPPTRVVLVALVSLVEQVGGQPLGARGARAVWTPSRRLATGSTWRGRRGRPTARRPARWRWSSRPRRARCCDRDAAARAAQSGRGPRLRRRRPAGQRPATAGRRRSRRAKHRRAR